MKSFSYLILLILTAGTLKVFTQTRSDEKLFPACKTGSKCGFIDRTGKWIIQPKFADAQEFSEGLAAVGVKIKGGEKYGFIDETGRLVIQPQFYFAWKFSGGLARFRMQENGNEGFVDKNGEIVVEPVLYQAEDFSEGLARVYKTTIDKSDSKSPVYITKSGFINTRGEVAIPLRYEFAGSFSEGLAFACIERGNCGYLDAKGVWKIEPKFLYGESFSEGLAAVQIKRGENEKYIVGDMRSNWGYINKSGEIVIEPKYYFPEPFSEGLAAVRLNSTTLFGYIDRTGKVVIPFRFYFLAGEFSEGLAAVYVGGTSDSPKYAFIDRTGKRISSKSYSQAFSFRNGLAFVGKANFLEKLDVSNFGGLAFSKTNYIDKTERVVWSGKD